MEVKICQIKSPPFTQPYKNSGWDNKQDGQTISHHRTKERAVEKGYKVAEREKTKHRIHNKNGQIAQSNSYGHDPNPPKDKK